MRKELFWLYKKFYWLCKITRPGVVMAGVLGTYVVAIVSNGHDILSLNKIAAATSMGFSCLGSSVCHFGIAHKIYKRKWYDPVPVKKPWLFVLTGLCFFAVSILIPAATLPPRCIYVAISIPLAIILYGKYLSKHWTTKNLLIAAVCTTPCPDGLVGRLPYSENLVVRSVHHFLCLHSKRNHAGHTGHPGESRTTRNPADSVRREGRDAYSGHFRDYQRPLLPFAPLRQ